ncbi:hypothetical protein MRB53_031129 [Persea americana]|uniref:Uncharacterized protein n=1 Tax=Persea americana TaxID=3435 RepID=A0ACC2KNL1_PERAE|nr:hypothetical protein MRB53_031129 [Persea americana]
MPSRVLLVGAVVKAMKRGQTSQAERGHCGHLPWFDVNGRQDDVDRGARQQKCDLLVGSGSGAHSPSIVR